MWLHILILLFAAKAFGQSTPDYQQNQRCPPVQPTAVQCYKDRNKNEAEDEFIADEDAHWAWYKNKFDKKIKPEKEKEHRERFNRNRQFVAEHNLRFARGETSHRVELNAFADWSEEAINSLSGHRAVQSNGDFIFDDDNFDVTHVDGPWKDGFIVENPGPDGLPESIDWRDYGYVTGVGNQHRCGCCYAFAGMAALEGQIKRATGKLRKLSVQEIVDCSWENRNHGCHGGNAFSTYDYVRENGGVNTFGIYPFMAADSRHCRHHAKNKFGSVRGMQILRGSDEQKMKEAVAKVGPIFVSIAVPDHYQFYRDGIYKNETCILSEKAHAITIVGYGTDPVEGDYWIIKNSWGKRWGMDGFGLIARNQNTCDIANNPVYPII